MSVDLALDNITGDLLASPSNDVAIYRGDAVVAQRIRTRLLIPVGSWQLDETGSLGSRLHDLLREPISRVLTELPLVVKEALEPMTDINVQDVTTSYDESQPKRVGFTIVYSIVDSLGNVSDTQELTGLVPVSG